MGQPDGEGFCFACFTGDVPGGGAGASRGGQARAGDPGRRVLALMGDLRYADAGVDIDEGNRAVSLIRRTLATDPQRPRSSAASAHSAVCSRSTQPVRDPVLASSTNSVGTKVKIAIATGRHRGIGVDLVNHCVNDILCCGAEPLFFLDYFATGKLVPELLAELVDGMAGACRDAGCALIGGETAEMPGVYALGDYDIAGFIVGAVERDRASSTEPGASRATSVARPAQQRPAHQRLLAGAPHRGGPRAGLGRRAAGDGSAPLADLLLPPHRSYLAAVRELRARARRACHRPHHGRWPDRQHAARAARRDWAWSSTGCLGPCRRSSPRCRSAGGVHPEEMWRTFNMGIGMVVVVPAGMPTASPRRRRCPCTASAGSSPAGG